MEIIYKTGNIFDADSPVIIHGCNAQGDYNAGFAEQVRKRLPFAYTVYRQAYLERGLQLGEVIWALDIAVGRIVGNGITQAYYGSDGRRYIDYAAIRRVFREVDRVVSLSQDHSLEIAKFGAITEVNMPAIGSGLGGGEWTTIADIITEESQHFTPIVYVLDGKIPS